MSDKTLRLLIAAVIVMMLVFQIGTLISAAFGMAWGAVSAVIVAVVSFFSARLARAGSQNTYWFMLPTLLFTVIPIVYMIWQAITSNVSGWARLASFVPFMIGFGIPVLVLLAVYYELRKRTLHS
jgi:uncharacterized membrane protein